MKNNLLVRAFHKCKTGPSVICVYGKWMVGRWLIGYCNYNPFFDRYEIISYDNIQSYVHIVVPETIGRFTGFYDNTKWEDLSRDEMSEFLHNKKSDGTYNNRDDWKGRMIFENDILQYNIFCGTHFDCHSVVRYGEFEQDGSKGEYGAAKCYGPFVKVENFTIEDDEYYSANNFPKYEEEESIYGVVRYNNAVVIGDIHTNPEVLATAKESIALAKDKPNI